MWTYLFMGILLLIIGFAVHVLKWDMLIAGYNTMPKEKKKKVDTDGLSRFLGIYAYISGEHFCLWLCWNFWASVFLRHRSRSSF